MFFLLIKIEIPQNKRNNNNKNNSNDDTAAKRNLQQIQFSVYLSIIMPVILINLLTQTAEKRITTTKATAAVEVIF
jgi:hypothetical protein